MADLYAARAGLSKPEIVGMMDRETWISRAKALEDGFASGEMDAAAIEEAGSDDQKKAMAMIESAMAQQGFSRAQRRGVFQNLFHGTPSAAVTPGTTPRAGANVAQSFQNLMDTLKG